MDENGREILTWIEGEAVGKPWPPELRTDAGIRALGSLLRGFHDAARTFHPPADSEWYIGPRPLKDGEVICHGDLGTWNVIWRKGVPAGLIDWDFAEPGDPLLDLGELAFFAVPMAARSRCLEVGFDEAPDRARRLRSLCESYGGVDPRDVVDAAQENWLRDIDRIREFGPKGLAPWQGFMERGIDKGGEELVGWLRANRSLLISG